MACLGIDIDASIGIHRVKKFKSYCSLHCYNYVLPSLPTYNPYLVSSLPLDSTSVEDVLHSETRPIFSHSIRNVVTSCAVLFFLYRFWAMDH